MNRTFRSVWSERRQAYVAVAETVASGGRRPASTLSLVAPALCVLGLLGSHAQGADLPAGGQIVGGSGSIAIAGSTMTVNQSSARLAVDWQSFNIGQGQTVQFVQPDGSAVALNRVLGTDVSVIQGALKANGQVFLLNPNGVLFTPTARVEVGGVVASTLNLKTEDFMAGNYRFEGGSSNAVVNQGQITAAPGGTIALIAAKVTNLGLLQAERGNVLIGAGSKVRLDLGGPVKIEVEEGVLDALIEQGGAIRADGGLVYLTARAVGNLVTTVINHTGITEAQTLATGEKGQIMLMGGMTNDRILVGGTLDAGAPNGGDGGFVETSAASVKISAGTQVSTAAPAGKAGTWLIDPADFYIYDASFGGSWSDDGIDVETLSMALNNGSVTIQTSADGGGQGDIHVWAPVTKSSGARSTLTLAADRDINVFDSISGSLGSPLDVVLAARARGGEVGSVRIYGRVSTYGGDITIGGGDTSASGYAIATSDAGVRINAMLDATGDGSGVADDSLPTALTGGNVVIRGMGTSTPLGSYNWGVQVQNGSVITGGNGNIDITGYGGMGLGGWAVGSVGVLLESYAYLKSNTGNIIIRGHAGSGADAYGIASTETSKLIGTNGRLLFEGDSLMLRNGELTIYAGQDSDIKAPIVGCVSYYCESNPGFTKRGPGVLNLWGNAEAWASAPPPNTYDSTVNAVFTDDTNTVNVVGLTADQALFAFSSRPATVTEVTQSSSGLAPSVTTLSYTFGDFGTSGNLLYTGTGYALNDYWTTGGVFGNGVSLVAGTDYNFLYNGNAVTSFTNAGTYSVSLNLLNSAYVLAAGGSATATFKITPAPLTVTATAASKTYDGAGYSGGNGATYNGLVNNETASVLSGSLAYSGDSQGARNVGTYTITPSGLSSTNYAITYSGGTLTIDPRAITVTADNKNKTYGNGDPSLTWQVSSGSLVDGDTLTGALSRAPGENVGTYTIDASQLSNGNYLITANNGTLTIGRGSDNIIAATQSQVAQVATVTASILVAPASVPALPVAVTGSSGAPAGSAGNVGAMRNGGLLLVDVPDPASGMGSGAGSGGLGGASGLVRVAVFRGGLNTDGNQKGGN
ncbi:MBG domain-containing protein [uncultured Aquabacterium sp.]|uniref:two-partner secretion domain-containing protein n=1 Tax=uncultured Aquabacterium sp. TaxID=158753 RepID=UPI0025DD2871|nr:MBG domain-containing protein [uncultured Aquabacterium sp.]